MNNFERIKQMSIDEMAKFLADNAVCMYCKLFNLCKKSQFDTCEETQKEYLLKEFF